MKDGTPRKRIRVSFEPGRCIWPNCKRFTAGSPEQFLCVTHYGGILDRAEQRYEEWAAQRQARREAGPPGWIYYLRIGGHYKIGWARRLEQRLRQYPPDGQVLAVHEGSRADEAALHKRFAHLRAAGNEWYPLVPDITRHIEQLVAEHGQPDPALRCGPKPTEVRRPKIGRQGPSPRYWTGSRSA